MKLKNSLNAAALAAALRKRPARQAPAAPRKQGSGDGASAFWALSIAIASLLCVVSFIYVLAA